MVRVISLLGLHFLSTQPLRGGGAEGRGSGLERTPSGNVYISCECPMKEMTRVHIVRGQGGRFRSRGPRSGGTRAERELFRAGCDSVIHRMEINSICSFALWDAFLLVFLENIQATERLRPHVSGSGFVVSGGSLASASRFRPSVFFSPAPVILWRTLPPSELP